MSKRPPKRPNVGVRILGFMAVWILAPIACFVLGMMVIGPRFVDVKPKPVPPNAQDANDPPHASEWLSGDQLPTRLGPAGGYYERPSRRHRGAQTKQKPKDDTLDNNPPAGDTNPTDQTTDTNPDQPTDNGPEKTNDNPPDVQQPDGVK
jgi:hypothetical protein